MTLPADDGEDCTLIKMMNLMAVKDVDIKRG
jgi:hypothetical protein